MVFYNYIDYFDCFSQSSAVFCPGSCWASRLRSALFPLLAYYFTFITNSLPLSPVEILWRRNRKNFRPVHQGGKRLKYYQFLKYLNFKRKNDIFSIFQNFCHVLHSPFLESKCSLMSSLLSISLVVSLLCGHGNCAVAVFCFMQLWQKSIDR